MNHEADGKDERSEEDSGREKDYRSGGNDGKAEDDGKVWGALPCRLVAGGGGLVDGFVDPAAEIGFFDGRVGALFVGFGSVVAVHDGGYFVFQGI